MRRMFGKFALFKSLAEKSLANEYRSTKGLLIVTTTLNGFSLANDTASYGELIIGILQPMWI